MVNAMTCIGKVGDGLDCLANAVTQSYQCDEGRKRRELDKPDDNGDDQAHHADIYAGHFATGIAMLAPV